MPKTYRSVVLSTALMLIAMTTSVSSDIQVPDAVLQVLEYVVAGIVTADEGIEWSPNVSAMLGAMW